MKRFILNASVLVISLTGCGGGDGGTSSGPVVVAPTPPSPPPPPPPLTALTYLYNFGTVSAAGGQPNGPLLQASDGNFYGTTRAGGTSGCTVGCGVIFRVTADGTATGLHSFGDQTSDGEKPTAPLVQGRDGALYGTTSFGGAYGYGTVFKITLDGIYTVLYSFGSTSSDGAVPVAGLIQGTDGNFYGTTSTGGANRCTNVPGMANNCGTVFRITPAGVETVLYSFGASVADGVQPEAPLLQGSDGNFYGTTVTGGANSCSTTGATNNCGTAFKMTPNGALTILHSFGQGSAPGILSTDGIAPQGPLIQGDDGAFYGTTVSGGQGRCGGFFGCGTVYRITSAGALTILYTFATSSISDGYGPSPFLTLARDGNFYGTTGSGGAKGGDLFGTVFRLTPSGAKTILYSFGPSSSPTNPVGGLTQGADGAFYGLTFYGATGGPSGTVFKLSP
jgi:uncharacterized repeat protein (TIGR03803 family)